MINLDSNTVLTNTEIAKLKTSLENIRKVLNDVHNEYINNYLYNTSMSQNFKGAIKIEPIVNMHRNFTNLFNGYIEFLDNILRLKGNLTNYLETYFGIETTYILQNLYNSIIENLQTHLPQILDFIKSGDNGSVIFQKIYDRAKEILQEIASPLP